MPVVTKDKKFEDYLIGLIMKNYETRESRAGGKWHVSELMFPRYAVLQRVLPQKPSRDEVGFFLTGEAYHEFMQRLLGTADSEVRGELLNVLGTADYFNGETLLEIKTSRKWTVPEEPQAHYIEQAGYYCAIFGKLSARIAVIFPTAGRRFDGSTSSTVEIVAWNVAFSPEEIEDVKTSMAIQVIALDRAARINSIDDLSFCQAWKCGSVQRNTEEQTYEVELRCPYAKRGMCGGNPELFAECQYKMDHRRVIKPKAKAETTEAPKRKSRYA